MKRTGLLLMLAATACGCNCWRPYYGQTYAPPAYQQAPLYQQPQVYQQPVMQQAPVMQPNCCPPVSYQQCVPCY